MKNKNRWISVLIFNFCVVAFLGFILRSKILFSIPFLDYNRLLDAHFHFAFSAWVTLALAALFIYDLLPADMYRPVHQWLLLSILAASWLLLITSPLPANSIGANVSSTVFILVTYVFGGVLISDIRRSLVGRTVRLLSITALICLMLSSTGVFALAYLFAAKSLSMFAYRDALYTYLHLMYNGFFTLGVFTLLIHRLERRMSADSKQKAFQFSIMLSISTFPSLFLTYLWRDPNEVFRIIAICGSVTLFVSFLLLLRLTSSLSNVCRSVTPLIRTLGYLSITSFALKVFLQSFTLFPAIGNAVFGDRPVIIGFLHLVFLGFVTLFLMAYFAYDGFLDMGDRFNRFALITFAVGVVMNEIVLMTQGLGAMFILSGSVFPRLLWAVSIALFVGALLIAIARFRSVRSMNEIRA